MLNAIFLDPANNSILIDARNGKGPESKTREMMPVPGFDGFVFGSKRMTSAKNKTLTLTDALVIMIANGFCHWKRIGKYTMHPVFSNHEATERAYHPFSVGDLAFSRIDTTMTFSFMKGRNRSRSLIDRCIDGSYDLTSAGWGRYYALCAMFPQLDSLPRRSVLLTGARK
jgi:hypothetical protein